MEVTTGVRAKLLSIAALDSYVAGKVYKDRLEDTLDGSGGRAVVVDVPTGWATPQQVNTQEYPIVRVRLWADHQRDADGNVTVYDGLTSARAMYRSMDSELHGVRDERWGATLDRAGLFVVTCQRWTEPVPSAEPERLGSEAACLQVLYALQVIH
jgi:hypothetical protein